MKKKRERKLDRKTTVLNVKGLKKKWTFKQWTAKEHAAFADAVRKHGKDITKIVEAVKTKTRN